MDASARRGIDVVAYFKLFRFPLVFTAIADSAAGYLLACRTGSGSEIVPGVLGWLAAASAGLYLFGMAGNDLVDWKKDQATAPGRPIPSGRVSLRGALIAAGASLAISLLAMAMVSRSGGLRISTPWMIAAVAIGAYNALIKKPPVMGLVRSANFLMGAAAGRPLGAGDDAFSWAGTGLLALPPFVYGTCLTFVSTLEDEAFSGRKLWAGVAGMILALLLAAGLIPFAEMHHRTAVDNPAAWVRAFSPAFLPAVLLSAWIARRARGATDRRGVMMLVRDGVAGYIVLDVVLLMSTGASFLWQPAAVLALLIPAAVSIAIFKRLA